MTFLSKQMSMLGMITSKLLQTTKLQTNLLKHIASTTGVYQETIDLEHLAMTVTDEIPIHFKKLNSRYNSFNTLKNYCGLAEKIKCVADNSFNDLLDNYLIEKTIKKCSQ